MDVVKIRLQSQVRPLAEGECFLFSNGWINLEKNNLSFFLGLMDHLCHVCKKRIENGNGAGKKSKESIKIGKFGYGKNGLEQCEWFNRPGHFSSTLV